MTNVAEKPYIEYLKEKEERYAKYQDLVISVKVYYEKYLQKGDTDIFIELVGEKVDEIFNKENK